MKSDPTLPPLRLIIAFLTQCMHERSGPLMEVCQVPHNHSPAHLHTFLQQSQYTGQPSLDLALTQSIPTEPSTPHTAHSHHTAAFDQRWDESAVLTVRLFLSYSRNGSLTHHKTVYCCQVTNNEPELDMWTITFNGSLCFQSLQLQSVASSRQSHRSASSQFAGHKSIYRSSEGHPKCDSP